MSNQRQAALGTLSQTRRVSGKRMREMLDAYAMLLPTILGVAIFFAVPLGISLYLSFTDAQLFGTPSFIGLENYQQVFRDPDFYAALKNTFVYSAATLVLSTVPALLLAVLLNERIRGQSFFRALFFIPVVASVVAVSLLWRYLLNLDFGFVNYGLSLLGFQRIEWLTSPDYALLSVILVSAWRTIGYNMVIFLAGLQGISRPLYEAASIDGAGRWQQFTSITLPMLSPTTFFVCVTTLINCLQIFAEPYALGFSRSNAVGPADSMLTIVPMLYREGFISNHMGYASSLAWVLFVMIMVITFVQFRMSSRWVNYE
ncbi:MAG: sugar ABC transporter permease [Roseiflexaceae bacterium]